MKKRELLLMWPDGTSFIIWSKGNKKTFRLYYENQYSCFECLEPDEMIGSIVSMIVHNKVFLVGQI